MSNQLNTHLTASNDAPFRFAYNSSTQEYGYIIDEGGADTFVPFKSGGYADFTGNIAYGTSIAVTPGDVYLITYEYQRSANATQVKGLSSGGTVLKDFGNQFCLVYNGWDLVGIHTMLVQATAGILTFTYNDASNSRLNSISIVKVGEA